MCEVMQYMNMVVIKNKKSCERFPLTSIAMTLNDISRIYCTISLQEKRAFFALVELLVNDFI